MNQRSGDAAGGSLNTWPWREYGFLLLCIIGLHLAAVGLLFPGILEKVNAWIRPQLDGLKGRLARGRTVGPPGVRGRS